MSGMRTSCVTSAPESLMSRISSPDKWDQTQTIFVQNLGCSDFYGGYFGTITVEKTNGQKYKLSFYVSTVLKYCTIYDLRSTMPLHLRKISNTRSCEISGMAHGVRKRLTYLTNCQLPPVGKKFRSKFKGIVTNPEETEAPAQFLSLTLSAIIR